MPFCIGVSGGIAAGKSRLCALWQTLHVGIIDADVIARDLVAPGQPALREIAQQFGKHFIQANGHLDRAGLRQYVFHEPKAKLQLEGILHPRIQAQLRLQSEHASNALVAVVIPLLRPETRLTHYAWLDRVLIVEAPIALQLERICTRDQCSESLAQAMIDAQLSSAERLPMADDVLINDGPLPQLHDWATQLHQRYRNSTGAVCCAH